MTLLEFIDKHLVFSSLVFGGALITVMVVVDSIVDAFRPKR